MQIYTDKHDKSEKVDIEDWGDFADSMVSYFSGIVEKKKGIENYVRWAFLRNLEKLEELQETKVSNLSANNKNTFLEDVFVDAIRLLRLDSRDTESKKTSHFNKLKEDFDSWEKGKADLMRSKIK